MHGTSTAHRLALRFAAQLLCALMIGTLSACGLFGRDAPAPPPPPPTPLSLQPYNVTLTVTTSSALNPDSRQRPSPVRAYVYLTEPDSNPESMSFEDLLGLTGKPPALEPSATATLRPGQEATLTLSSVKSKTRLSVVAAYRQPYQSQWLATRVLVPEDTVNVAARIDAAIVSFPAISN